MRYAAGASCIVLALTAVAYASPTYPVPSGDPCERAFERADRFGRRFESQHAGPRPSAGGSVEDLLRVELENLAGTLARYDDVGSCGGIAWGTAALVRRAEVVETFAQWLEGLESSLALERATLEARIAHMHRRFRCSAIQLYTAAARSRAGGVSAPYVARAEAALEGYSAEAVQLCDDHAASRR